MFEIYQCSLYETPHRNDNSSPKNSAVSIKKTQILNLRNKSLSTDNNLKSNKSNNTRPASRLLLRFVLYFRTTKKDNDAQRTKGSCEGTVRLDITNFFFVHLLSRRSSKKRSDLLTTLYTLFFENLYKIYKNQQWSLNV